MKQACCLVIFVFLVASARSQQSRYDPAPRKAAKQQSSFIDFALKQVNPANTDYGSQIDETRKTLLGATIETEVWWTAVVASVFFFLCFFVILHQHRESSRRTSIAAEFMAQYHNAVVNVRSAARKAIERHDQAVDLVTDKVETRAGGAAGELNATRATVKPRERMAVEKEPPKNTRTVGGETTEGNASAQIRALQQQMNQMQLDIDAGRRREDAGREREKNLQRELDRLRRQLAPGPDST